MKLDKQLALNCYHIRRKAKISMREFADKLGLKIEDIKDFERNMKPIPTLVLVEYQKLKEGFNEIQNR